MYSGINNNVDMKNDDTIDLLKLAMQLFTLKHIVIMVLMTAVFGLGTFTYAKCQAFG